MSPKEKGYEGEDGDLPEGADAQSFGIADDVFQPISIGGGGNAEIYGCFEMAEHHHKIEGLDDGGEESGHYILVRLFLFLFSISVFSLPFRTRTCSRGRGGYLLGAPTVAHRGRDTIHSIVLSVDCRE